MSVIEERIEVAASLRATYDQWTQFEQFPEFMEGVDEVRQLDDTHLHWVASIAGVTREWDARVTEQLPDQLIAWTSMDGVRNDGLVTFDAVGANHTEVTLRLDVEPEGPVEAIGDALGVIRRRTRGDLERFRSYIESRDHATGAWRGEVREGGVVDAAPPRATEPARSTRPDPVGAPGEVPASTGGVVDLDRIIGTIPILLVFVEPFPSPSATAVLESLGRHLVEFGRDRVQVLAVARVDAAEAARVADAAAGEARVLADPDGDLAARLGVEYRPDHPTTALIGADGRHEATWVDEPGPDMARDLRLRLQQLSGR